jgi:Protein of unknown function (DUF1559)
MGTATCSHCGASANPEQTDGWCEQCGKPLGRDDRRSRENGRRREVVRPVYDAKNLPRPLGDPLRVVRVLMIVSAIMAVLGTVVWSVLMPTAEMRIVVWIPVVLVLPFFFAVWRLLPDRPTNAFYLRSFTNDAATLPVRQEIVRGLGKELRLSGIRDPRRRAPRVLRYLLWGLFAIRYCSPRFMNLEAGNEWKARLWRSFGDARCAFVDVSHVTSFVGEEIELCEECLGLERILFIAHSPEQRDAFLAENPLPPGIRDRIQVAVWGRDRRAFREQVRAFAQRLPAHTAGLQMDALRLTRSASLPDGPIKSGEGIGWAEAVAGTLLCAALRLLAPNVMTLLALLFLVSLVYLVLRYIIEVGNSPERYKAVASFGFAFGWLTLGVGLLVPASQNLMMQAKRLQSQNNLKRIAYAIEEYEDRHKELPRAGGTDQRGQPVGLSWRVQLLPYLGEDSLYQQFKLDKPWDSPANRRLLAQMPKVYAHPLADADQRAQGYTYYRVFVGPGAGFRPGPPTSSRGRPERGSTILAVEAAEPVPWTKPDELEFAPNQPLPPLGGLFPDAFHAVFFDGFVDSFRQTTDEATLRWYIAPRLDVPMPSEPHGSFGRMFEQGKK